MRGNNRYTAVATIIVAFITGVCSIITTIITKNTNKKVDAISEVRKEFNSQMKNHILESDKTYLVDFLSDIESGGKKTDIQVKRAYEIFEEYSQFGGNSYVHDRWAVAKKNGLI